jgi:hypothetical protein
MARKTELPPEAKGKRISRRQAMDRVQERTGRTISETTLVYGWRVPYFIDGRNAVYLEEVVDDYIGRHLARVSQQVHCYEGFPRSKPPVNRIASRPGRVAGCGATGCAIQTRHREGGRLTADADINPAPRRQ